MPTIKKNPTDANAAIIFENKKLKVVFPDELVVVPGEKVEWEITLPEDVTVVFDPDSPFDWSKQSSSSGRIKGRIKREAIGIYKYSVTDIAGEITIDPRIRVKR
jgi:plastocyanin